MYLDITTVTTDYELVEILQLQSKNLYTHVDKAIALQSGFVTVKHSLDVLKMMSKSIPQIVAKHNGKIIGYALTMLKEFKCHIPELQPMFKLFDEIEYQGRVISSYKFYVMGQICIEESYRGMNIFDKLYDEHKNNFASNFDFCITEVAKENTRSMKAHERVGFKTIYSFTDSIQEWNIILWDFR